LDHYILKAGLEGATGQNPCAEGRRASLHQKTPPIYIHALVSIAAMQKSYSLGIP
jgi:hypothetical protein